ncbi:unnamed protein product [Rhizoctonia solani]|uniref:Uncharacterized protein n=1 Tax=Rhizoctonia solani TaxID=456999 RepID=A0A8H3HP12_9AGAM|nr:unnamed protein product [Rhizoctonia solani]
MTSQKNTPVTNPPIVLGNDPGAQLPSPAPSYGIERPVMFSKHSGRWYITLRQESDVIPLIRHLANEHPKSICVISHSQSAFAYGDIFDPLSRFSVIRSGKKARSVEDALAKFSQWGVPSGLCLLRGIASSTGNESVNFQWATGDALIYWGLPPQDSFLWPISVAKTRFAHVYVITPPAQLPTVTSLIGNAFQAHPDSPLVNEQGPGSLLYHSREICKQTLASLPRSTINNIVKFYQPVHPPVYFSREFMMKTMPWVNF